MSFKIAVDAGHCLKTAGKRLHKKLDATETREWTINDRVARHFAEAAKQYEGVELLRVDDTSGQKKISLANRCKAANNWGADMYISMHHNAGVKLGSGGGIVAYSYKNGTKGAEYRDEIYKACIAAGGLVGNRAEPVQAYGFYVLKHTNAPAVLMEYGFMDSTTDAPVILSDSYSKLMGYSTMEGIAKAAGLRKKVTEVKPTEPVETKQTDLPVLKRSDNGKVVEAMQILLDLRGVTCADGGADGSFGPATENAVRAFQKKNGLTVDGICGLNTWAKLLGLS